MAKLINLIGRKFGRWEVLSRSDINISGKPAWVCKCECGTERVVSSQSLNNGSTSCGCKREESLTKHGMWNCAEYGVWRSMLSRCNSECDKSWYLYGGRGIKVCDRWYDINKFIEDMGNRPSIKHSIDRIDTNGDYTPENCHWVLPIEQGNNRRNNIYCLLNGKRLTVAQAARELNINHSTILRKVNRGIIEVGGVL